MDYSIFYESVVMPESITKYQIDPLQAEKIVQRHFGRDQSIVHIHEYTDGYYNAVYHLVLTSGKDCILKIAPTTQMRVMRYEKNLMQAEVASLQLVRQRTEMPVPLVLAHDASYTLLPNEYFLMETIHGSNYNQIRGELTPAQQAVIDYEIGRLLAQMNLITGERFGYYAQPDQQAGSWRAAFDSMLQGVLADGQDLQVPLSLPYEKLYDRLSACFDALDEVKTPCLVHWDLWDGNIFIDPETARITGMIDFERVMWADPLMEFNFGFPRPDFLAGYGRPMLETENQRLRRSLYNLYLDLILIIEAYFREYPDRTLEGMARCWLDQELSRLP